MTSPATGYVRISVKLPEPLSKRLEHVANDRLVSPSVLIARAVERLLADLPSIDAAAPGPDTP